MIKKMRTFKELKRKVYLVVLPCILLNILITLFIQTAKQDVRFEFYANILFFIIFIIGWFVVYFKLWQKFFELVILLILVLYQWFSILLAIRNHVSEGISEIGSFVIWLPLIVIYIFAILKRKWAIWTSIVLLLGTVFPAVYYFQYLSATFIESLSQVYLATSVYIVVLIFSYKLFQAQAEIEYMRRKVYLDPLTKIANRHQIDEWLKGFLENAQENQFSIIFFDIDRFKSINDRFGHKVGDEVLIELTRIVHKEIGSQYYFGRWGGEEFIILLHGSECEAYSLAEKVRRIIETNKYNDIAQVTASFGVTGFVEGDTVDSILVRADKRLYESKETGRNRVTGKL